MSSSINGHANRMSSSESIAPPCAAQRTVTVIENVAIARDTYRLRLDDPEMARSIVPGQFLMIRAGGGTDPLLGRPFALYDVVRDASGDPDAIDVVYLVVGRGTAAPGGAGRATGCRSGDRLATGSARRLDGPVVFVAGGIGQTPFLALGALVARQGPLW